jgi:hypothetical protein
LELTRTLFFDAYSENRGSGAFILVDVETNATLAAGMIRGAIATDEAAAMHQAALIDLRSHESWADDLEKELLAAGSVVVRTRVTAEKTLRQLLSLGLVVLLEGKVDDGTLEQLGPISAANFTSLGDLLRQLDSTGAIPRQKGAQ